MDIKNIVDITLFFCLTGYVLKSVLNTLTGNIDMLTDTYLTSLISMGLLIRIWFWGAGNVIEFDK